MSLGPILQHSSSPARISVQQGPARMSMQQPAGSLSISNGSPSLEIQHRDGRLSIDSKASRASMKYFSMLGLLGEISRISRQAGNSGVGEIVSDGLAYQSVEQGSGAIKSVAASKMWDNKQFGVVLMPSVPPRISYSPGSVSISARGGATRVQFQRSAPIINVEPQPAQISVSSPQLNLSVPGAPSLDLRA